MKWLRAFLVLFLALHTSLLLAEDFVSLDSLGRRVPILMPTLTVEREKSNYEKNNPAYQLVQRAIEAELRQREERSQDFSYRKIDQVTLSVANVPLQSKWLHKLIPFFKDYLKESALKEGKILPLKQTEQISLMVYNAKENRIIEGVLHHKKIGIEDNIDDGSISMTLEEFFPDVDLFEGSVQLLQNRFVSPLSKSGSNFYKYFLTDTIITKGRVAHVVEYIPHEPSSIAFQGVLLFTATDSPRLLRSYIVIPPSANVNFVDDFIIQQDFTEQFDGSWHKEREVMDAAFKLFWNLLSLEMSQERRYEEYLINPPYSQLLNSSKSIVNLEKTEMGKAVTKELSEKNILPTDEGLRSFLDQVKKVPHTKLILDLVEMISYGYIRTNHNPSKIYGGSHFDVGPILKTIGFNPLEGLRLTLGGKTTGYLSRNFFLEGYWAYGVNDMKHKYNVTATYSFRPKLYFKEEHPRNELSVTKEYDMYTPGEDFHYDPSNTILNNVGVSYLTERSYRDAWRIQYLNDVSQNFSVRLYGHYHKDAPTGALEYVQVMRDQSMVQLPHIKDTAIGIELRWSPGERIKDGSMQRHSFYRRLQNNVPIFHLKHETALKSLGGDFNRNRTEVSLEQRLWLDIFGRLDYQITVGMLWDPVPYPMLYTPPTNRSFVLRNHTFQLLRPLEFIGDQWLSLFAQYHMQGFLFNRIPLIKHLNIRGVFIANFLYGHTSKKNSQESSHEIFVLPTISTEMKHTPYLELGFGIENILGVGRIDVYRRVTSTGPHSESPWAVRGTLRVDF